MTRGAHPCGDGRDAASDAGPPDLAALRGRLARMVAINAACVLVAGAAAAGAMLARAPALYLVFAAALLTGFASHVWLIAGLGARRRAEGSV